MRQSKFLAATSVLLSACATRQPAATAGVAPSAPAVAAANVCAAPSRETTYTTIGATLAQPQARLFSAASNALSAQGFAIARSDSVAGMLVTGPRFTWPAGTAAETWHGEANPGVEVTVRAAARGMDSTAFQVGARALCLVPEPGQSVPSTKVGKTLEMITALQVVKAVRADRARR